MLMVWGYVRPFLLFWQQRWSLHSWRLENGAPKKILPHDTSWPRVSGTTFGVEIFFSTHS